MKSFWQIIGRITLQSDGVFVDKLAKGFGFIAPSCK